MLRKITIDKKVKPIRLQDNTHFSAAIVKVPTGSKTPQNETKNFLKRNF